MKNFKKDERTSNELDSKKESSSGRSKKYKKGSKNASKQTKSVKGNVNDVTYYYSDPNVLASVTNFSFTEFLGVDAELGSVFNDPTDVRPVTLTESVNNIIAIRLNPSVQPTAKSGATGAEAINSVALRNYTNLTAGNGKTSNYAPSDPMIAIFAIGSAVSMYSHIKRAFNSYSLVNQRNRDYPELLFRAMGIDWADFKANIANYRDQFNLLVCQFDKIPMFNDIKYLDKCLHLYEFIYVDEDSPLAQTYLFTPNSVWELDEAYDPNGSGLVTVPLYTSSIRERSMAELLEIFASQIIKLTTSSTLNQVYSDILRLMSNGKGSPFILNTIPLTPDPNFGPIINDEIRHWVNNMMIVPQPIDKDAVPAAISRGTTNSNDVASDASTGSILYAPTFLFREEDSVSQEPSIRFHSTLIRMWFNNNFVNFDSMNPSIEDKVAAIRMAIRANVQTYVDSSVPNRTMYTYAQDIDLGDFYCVGMHMFSSMNDEIPDVSLGDNYYLITTNANAGQLFNEVVAFSRWADYLSKFKYAPRFAILDAVNYTSSGQNALKGIWGDLSYYTLLDHKLIKRIKDAEMYALFDFRLN